MVFTSWVFVAFFVAVLFCLRVAPSRVTRQLVILIASVFFYGYWNTRYLLLLATPSVIDYYCAQFIERETRPDRRRAWLMVSLVTNLGLLAYFKYADFFLATFASIVGAHSRTLNLLLPVGISFYTFKTLSYTIDVYRKDIKACEDWWRYAMFVTYFPELVAGPIVRASVFLPQMSRSLRPSFSRFVVGCHLILLGVTKKLLVADRLAVLADAVFARPEIFSPLTVLSGVIAYSLQIYCDFSGYSDIAIGVSRIIGYDLPENFRMPYIATSVTEFWRRWHMTLSSWLRDYLYIPLGGNRKGRFRTYLNLMITMLLGGLWHGASWTFVLWGCLHGAGLAVHKLWTTKSGNRVRAPKIVAWALTYSFVCLGWILFRSERFGTAIAVFRKAAFLDRGGIDYFYLPLALTIPLVVAAHWFGHVIEVETLRAASPRRIAAPRWAAVLYRHAGGSFAVRPHQAAGYYAMLPIPGFAGGALVTLWVLVLYLFASMDTNPFIYFQF